MRAELVKSGFFTRRLDEGRLAALTEPGDERRTHLVVERRYPIPFLRRRAFAVVFEQPDERDVST